MVVDLHGLVDQAELKQAEQVNRPRPDESVNHPAHYTPGPYEVYKVLAAWGLESNAPLWNAAKYIARCGKKLDAVDGQVQDLEKAKWYLDLAIRRLKGEPDPDPE